MTELRVIHSSQQFSDDHAQHVHDAGAIFRYADKQGALFLTGTEAGGDDVRNALQAAAKEYGWRINAHRWGEWVALNNAEGKATDEGWEGPFIPGLSRAEAGKGTYAPRGITWVTAEVPDVGTVSMGCVHYLTVRSNAASGASNRPLAKGIADWGADKGKGKHLALVNGDWNMDDKHRDVFLGKPFTTSWDELGKHPATHGRDKAHGRTIDACASYNADGRVKAKAARVLDDHNLPLFADHFAIETVWAVAR